MSTFPTIDTAIAAGFTMANLRYDDGLYDFEGGYILARASLTDFATLHHLNHADAIEKALDEGYTLHTYADVLNDAQDDVTAEYAEQAAQTDPGLVYLTR